MCRRVCCVVHFFLCVYVATMELVDLIDKEVLSVAVPQYSLRQISPEEFRKTHGKEHQGLIKLVDIINVENVGSESTDTLEINQSSF